MKKLAGIVLTVMVGLGMLSTTAMADADKGQKLFVKKLKKACGSTGAKMAGSHTQDEWEEINEDEALADEIKKICPRVDPAKGLKDKYIPHYYDFFYEFANDSGNVPSC